MRLFVAIDLDQRDYFQLLQKQLPNTAQYTFSSTFHITLKFIGEYPESALDQLKEKLKQVRFAPFVLETATLDIIPNEQRMHVVSVGLKPNAALNALQHSVSEALKGIGMPPHPGHITLCRVKNISPQNKKAFVEAVKKIKVEKKAFSVTEFRLVNSELTAQGSIYETVTVFPAITPKPL